ncbi:MAG: 5-methylthioribose kinase [Pseudonocardiales bacterium]|jgi:5-methylthioribose kinase|nr:5-methylthioribose kinase [Pseudonocardiales bacterium]
MSDVRQHLLTINRPETQRPPFGNGDDVSATAPRDGTSAGPEIGVGYRALTAESVLEFAAPFLDGVATSAVEISDGNLNVVFRVFGASGSVIVKQALPYLRVAGESWPLTRHRARIEADAIAIHDKLLPNVMPQLVHFDDAMSVLVLEDLSGHVTWREALIAGQAADGAAETTGEYSAAIILGTSDLLLPSRQRRSLRRGFVYSELCLVTEDLIFTAPYGEAESNRYDEAIAPLVQQLHRDRALRSAAAELRFAFKTRDEALIHGDLHSGSVMVAPGDHRVIDLEFAFFGPFGFDPGILLANLALSRLAHEAQGNHAYARTVDGYAAAYWASLSEHTRRLWDPSEPWYHQFLQHVLGDAARFMGMEMIRRIVGLAHAKDIDVLPDGARLQAQTRALAGGRALMVGPPTHSFDDIWFRAVGEDNLA